MIGRSPGCYLRAKHYRITIEVRNLEVVEVSESLPDVPQEVQHGGCWRMVGSRITASHRFTNPGLVQHLELSDLTDNSRAFRRVVYSVGSQGVVFVSLEEMPRG